MSVQHNQQHHMQPSMNQTGNQLLQANMVHSNMNMGHQNPTLHMMNPNMSNVNSLLNKPTANMNNYMTPANPNVNNTPMLQSNALTSNVKATRMSTPEKQRGSNRKKTPARSAGAGRVRVPAAVAQQQQSQQQPPPTQIGTGIGVQGVNVNWQSSNAGQPQHTMYQQHPTQINGGSIQGSFQ